MSKLMINDVSGLVTTWWDEELQALRIKWFTEYAEGSAVADAVEFAMAYVNENGVKNWLCDLSESREALKAEDQEWVQTEFKRLIAESSLEKVVLIPPLPETGQDTEWLKDWEANTKRDYGGQIDARLLSEEGEIQRLFEKG